MNAEVTFHWGGRIIHGRGHDLSASGISFYIREDELGRGSAMQRWALGHVIRMSLGESAVAELTHESHVLNMSGQIVRIVPNERRALVAVKLTEAEAPAS
jgi:hypothetical protein